MIKYKQWDQERDRMVIIKNIKAKILDIVIF